MYYLDKVAREMCHYLLQMRGRGLSNVYAIKKNPLSNWTYTPLLGTLYLKPPSKGLIDAYEKLRQEHMDALFNSLGDQLKVMRLRKEEKLRRALKPRYTFEQQVERARQILPEIYHPDRPLKKGRIDVNLMREKLDIGHNLAYRIRARLLRELEDAKKAII